MTTDEFLLRAGVFPHTHVVLIMRRSHKTEKKLLRRCLFGDNAAWEVFVDTYQPLIFSAIENVLVRQGVEPAGPLVENLFNRLFDSLMENDCQKLRQFRWKCELSKWLYLMATRLTLIHVRQEPSLESNYRDEFGSKPLSSNELHGQLPTDESDLRQEEWQCYKELKSILSAREQLFLKWFYELKLPLAEVADLLGVSINSGFELKQQVREKMKRCIKRLL